MPVNQSVLSKLSACNCVIHFQEPCDRGRTASNQGRFKTFISVQDCLFHATPQHTYLLPKKHIITKQIKIAFKFYRGNIP